MKVLHFITDYSSAAGPMAATVQRMMFSTSKMAETHLLTCTSLTEDYMRALMEQKSVHAHHLQPLRGNNPLQLIGIRGNILKVLEEVHPDVVHVHGSWDFTAAFVEHTARHKGYITVVSPQRGLSQEILNIDFWKKRLPRLIAYQAWMVRNCISVIAISEKEQRDVRSTGLKKRIEVLPEIPSSTSTALSPNLDVYGTALMTAYRKAMDSVYFRTLTQAEQDFVYTMVKAVTVDDDVTVQRPDIPSDGGVGGALSFRRIFFYAYDEDVLDMMLQGVSKMQLTIPPTPDIAAIPRYKNRKAKLRGSLSDVPMPSYKVSIPESDNRERDAVAMILRSKKLSFKRLTLRHYVELYNLFRNTDFNEDTVMNELRRIHRKGYTKKLQKKLHEMFALKDGYDIF